MRLGLFSNVDPVPGTSAGSTGSGDKLLARVTNAFPELVVTHSRVETKGGDHVMLVVNDAIIFRFPRAGTHDLSFEIEVLSVLQQRITLPTPAYTYLDPAGHFAGYRFIRGAELTPARFAALSPIAREYVLGEAARFLAALHTIPAAAIAWHDDRPTAWTAAEYATRAVAERLPSLARYAPLLAAPLARFYGLYRQDRAPRAVMIHGDLVAEHILLDPETDRLAGIIDFGDVALGDPAQDLLGFWSYGEAAVSRIIALYAPGQGDPGLLARSRNHFIRYRIDQLFDNLGEGESAGLACQGAEVETLLNGSGSDLPEPGD